MTFTVNFFSGAYYQRTKKLNVAYRRAQSNTTFCNFCVDRYAELLKYNETVPDDHKCDLDQCCVSLKCTGHGSRQQKLPYISELPDGFPLIDTRIPACRRFLTFLKRVDEDTAMNDLFKCQIVIQRAKSLPPQFVDMCFKDKRGKLRYFSILDAYPSFQPKPQRLVEKLEACKTNLLRNMKQTSARPRRRWPVAMSGPAERRILRGIRDRVIRCFGEDSEERKEMDARIVETVPRARTDGLEYALNYMQSIRIPLPPPPVISSSTSESPPRARPSRSPRSPDRSALQKEIMYF